MSDQGNPGVLLRGDDGSHYFIPAGDLSQYAVDAEPDTADRVAGAAPRVDAFSVAQTESESTVAFMPIVERTA
jgi:hypothetical protein